MKKHESWLDELDKELEIGLPDFSEMDKELDGVLSGIDEELNMAVDFVSLDETLEKLGL